MDKSYKKIAWNNCKNKHTAKIIYIQDYFDKRETLQNSRREQMENFPEETPEKVTYFDEDRQKTLDLFVRVLYTMKKENFQ
jgi:hypothetical protein